ncbi:MAG: hypothetical protein ACRC28_05035 [Clostridium sp.]|uniref:hypothetical protein n=1 Tax=Clostridium sp. TaxID=1506 RepID=UPI003F2F796D
MDTFAIWDKLYKDKLKWAYEARDEFYNAIGDEDVRDIYINASKEIYVCVYGRSQVGKTTLILKLIGIKEEYIKKVSDILRGKRRRGNSATITATIYTVSEDEYFYYEEVKDDVKKCTEEEMQEVLKELRERACRGEANTKSIKIAIPKKYFETREAKNAINIIDLPGVESDDLAEYEHVEKIIKTFVPVSNMILLIERADQVAYLQNLKLPGIDCWYEDTERFKVILTRAVSNNSTKKEILEKDIMEKMEYVKLFENDIRKDSEKIELKEKMIYPLEYGESWEELKKKEIDIVSKVSPIFEQLYEELEEEIIKSQNEYSKLMMSMQMYNRIEKNILNKENAYKNEISKKETLIKESCKDIFKISTLIKIIRDEKKEYLNRIQILREIRGKDISYKSDTIVGGKKNTKSLSGHLEDRITEYVGKYSSTILEINSKLEELDITQRVRNTIMDIFLEEASWISNRLDTYWIDKYYIDSNFEEDRDSVKEAVNSANCRAIKIIKDEKEKIASRHIEEYKKNIENLDGRIKAYEIRKGYMKGHIEQLEKEKETKEQELRVYMERANKDLKASEKYREFLHEGYKREYKSINREIQDEKTNSEEKIANLMYLYLISDELSKLEETLK